MWIISKQGARMFLASVPVDQLGTIQQEVQAGKHHRPTRILAQDGRLLRSVKAVLE
ncbi:hypothetical protein Vi05172_g10838 [Venturia inaequalis]|nr:hypothetical protein Vi05172_g10838 [Venturia inaequalis]